MNVCSMYCERVLLTGELSYLISKSGRLYVSLKVEEVEKFH